MKKRNKKVDKVDYWRQRMSESRNDITNPPISPGAYIENTNNNNNKSDVTFIDKISNSILGIKNNTSLLISLFFSTLSAPYLAYVVGHGKFLATMPLLVTLFSLLFFFVTLVLMIENRSYKSIMFYMLPIFIFFTTSWGVSSQMYLSGKPVLYMSTKYNFIKDMDLIKKYTLDLDSKNLSINDIINKGFGDTSVLKNIIADNDRLIIEMSKNKSENFKTYREDLLNSYREESDCSNYTLIFLDKNDSKYKSLAIDSCNSSKEAYIKIFNEVSSKLSNSTSSKEGLKNA